MCCESTKLEALLFQLSKAETERRTNTLISLVVEA
jgi:hypothetical protein